jgi:hypothetical protein
MTQTITDITGTGGAESPEPTLRLWDIRHGYLNVAARRALFDGALSGRVQWVRIDETGQIGLYAAGDAAGPTVKVQPTGQLTVRPLTRRVPGGDYPVTLRLVQQIGVLWVAGKAL